MTNIPTAKAIKAFVTSKGGQVTAAQLTRHFKTDIVNIMGTSRSKELMKADLRMFYSNEEYHLRLAHSHEMV